MTLTRRRFFTLASAACLMAGAPAQAYRWQGTALGAKAQIILDHPKAEQITARAMGELSRLEQVFSLYRPTSDLSRLNAAGRLDAPAFELLDCLSLARHIHRLTQGRFDPTVQVLWQVLARAAIAGQAPDAAALAQARGAIGFDRVQFDAGAVRLGRGQALTLNGIAQGYIADRIAALMAQEGITDVLIDTGEITAMGRAAGHDGWPVSITQEPQKRLLQNRALATSAIMGSMIGAGQGHILDPRSGMIAAIGAKQVSISADSAGLADGLSTALSLTRSRAEAAQLLSNVKESRIESYIA